jgi:hypothetical protein
MTERNSNPIRDRNTRMMSHAAEMYALLKQLVLNGADVRQRAAHVLHQIDSGQRSGADYSNLMPEPRKD